MELIQRLSSQPSENLVRSDKLFFCSDYLTRLDFRWVAHLAAFWVGLGQMHIGPPRNQTSLKKNRPFVDGVRSSRLSLITLLSPESGFPRYIEEQSLVSDWQQ